MVTGKTRQNETHILRPNIFLEGTSLETLCRGAITPLQTPLCARRNLENTRASRAKNITHTQQSIDGIGA